jgi:hypothetical protein
MKAPVVIINRCNSAGKETPTQPPKQQKKKSFSIQFGSDFRRGISNTHCAIGYLLTNDLLRSVKGTIDVAKTNSIKKSYLWAYIVYLLHWNREVQPFASVLYTKTASEAQLVNLVSSVLGTQEKAFNKSQLVSFINTVTSKLDLVIPVLNNNRLGSANTIPSPSLSSILSNTNTISPQQMSRVNVYGQPAVYNQQDGKLSIDLDLLVSPVEK